MLYPSLYYIVSSLERSRYVLHPRIQPEVHVPSPESDMLEATANCPFLKVGI